MKIKKIATIILVGFPSLVLIASSIAKFAGATVIITNLTKAGIIPYFPLAVLGVIELASVLVYLNPKSWKIGFYLLCCYLGGAGAIEISQHLAPTAFILLTIVWVGAFLRDKSLFVQETI